MSEIWLTSDFHFNHDKNFIWESRGFSSVEEMNEVIIERFNKVVQENDIVYILGDCMLGDLEAGLECMARLKGRKYLAYGNHDTDNRVQAYKENQLFEDIQMGYRLKAKRHKTYILTHYPTFVANRTKDNIYSIHGHTHSKEKWSDVPHAYNVNVDAHDCRPVNIEDLYKEIS